MAQKTQIRRNLMLKELEVKEDHEAKQRVFSIAFIKDDGERVFLPRAVATGLRFSMSKFRMRGVMPVDKKGDQAGHVYPVLIDNIVEFNQMEVML